MGCGNPIVEEALPNQKVEDLLCMQRSLITIKPSFVAQDGWVKEGKPHSIRGCTIS